VREGFLSGDMDSDGRRRGRRRISALDSRGWGTGIAASSAPGNEDTDVCHEPAWAIRVSLQRAKGAARPSRVGLAILTGVGLDSAGRGFGRASRPPRDETGQPAPVIERTSCPA